MTDVLPQALSEEPLLLLSPHADDAALSCAALLDRTRPLDVLTVFSGAPDPPRRSAWDRTTGFPDSAASSAARLAEERAVLAATPHRLELLDLLEIGYLDGPRAHGDAEAIAAAVSSWLDAHPDGTVAAPAGAGLAPGRIRARARRLLRRHGRLRHPDHLYVRDAALDAALLAPGSSRVALYEDFPYSRARAADDEVRRLARARGLTATPVVVAIDPRTKAARIALYASQTPYLVERGLRVDVAEDLPMEERYWLLDRSGGGRG